MSHVSVSGLPARHDAPVTNERYGSAAMAHLRRSTIGGLVAGALVFGATACSGDDEPSLSDRVNAEPVAALERSGTEFDDLPADAPERITVLLTDVDWTSEGVARLEDQVRAGEGDAGARTELLETVVSTVATEPDAVDSDLLPALARLTSEGMGDLFAVFAVSDEAREIPLGLAEPAVLGAELESDEAREFLSRLGESTEAADRVVRSAREYAGAAYDASFTDAPVRPDDAQAELEWWHDRADLADDGVAVPHGTIVTALGEDYATAERDAASELPQIAVYRHLPESTLRAYPGGAVFFDAGTKIPWEDWTVDQRDEWSMILGRGGPATAAGQVATTVDGAFGG